MDVPDIDVAIKEVIEFYKTVFGWKFEKWEGPMDYWLINTGKDEPGIDGGLARKKKGEINLTMNTIGVSDIDQAIKDVKANNGTIVKPKILMPGIGWLAFIKDPDGNMWIMKQEETSAK
ncbi:MAG: VOC family protein [Asgard group archaeon]|nr:VOC family protein [Asgard group archaeon]